MTGWEDHIDIHKAMSKPHKVQRLLITLRVIQCPDFPYWQGFACVMSVIFHMKYRLYYTKDCKSECKARDHSVASVLTSDALAHTSLKVCGVQIYASLNYMEFCDPAKVKATNVNMKMSMV